MTWICLYSEMDRMQFFRWQSPNYLECIGTPEDPEHFVFRCEVYGCKEATKRRLQRNHRSPQFHKRDIAVRGKLERRKSEKISNIK